MTKAQEIKKRSYMSHLSAAINKLRTQLAEETIDEVKIASLVEQVTQKFQKVEDIVAILQDDMDETKLEEDIEKMDVLENQVIEVKVQAKSAIEKLHGKKTKPEKRSILDKDFEKDKLSENNDDYDEQKKLK